jgi:hypothetical protein
MLDIERSDQTLIFQDGEFGCGSSLISERLQLKFRKEPDKRKQACTSAKESYISLATNPRPQTPGAGKRNFGP